MDKLQLDMVSIVSHDSYGEGKDFSNYGSPVIYQSDSRLRCGGCLNLI